MPELVKTMKAGMVFWVNSVGQAHSNGIWLLSPCADNELIISNTFPTIRQVYNILDSSTFKTLASYRLRYSMMNRPEGCPGNASDKGS